MVDTVINTYQSRAARYILPTSIPLPANTRPALRDVRRAGKIFSYTGRGAFFFIFEKEWGAQNPPHRTRCKIAKRIPVGYSTKFLSRMAPALLTSHILLDKIYRIYA